MMPPRQLGFLFLIGVLFYFLLPCGAEISEEQHAGQRYLVQKIRFEGHTHFTHKTLTERFGLQEGQAYSREEFIAGFARVLEAYRNAGFVFAELTPDALPLKTGNARDVTPDVPEVSLTIKIVEGIPLCIGILTLKIFGATEAAPRFSEGHIREELGLREGERFTQEALEKGIERIHTLYSENSYPKIEVEPTHFRFIAENGTVDFNLNIREGTSIQIGEVKVSGLKKTKLDVVLREIAVKPREPFQQRKIERSYQRLRNLGYFYDVHPDVLEAGKTEATINFHAHVTEARTGRLSGIIGYAPPESGRHETPQVTGVLEAHETNLLGTGRQVNFYWKTGLRKTLRFAYEEPWILGKPIAIGVAHATISQRNPYTEAVSEEQSARLSGKTNFGRIFEGVLTIGYTRINVPDAAFLSASPGLNIPTGEPYVAPQTDIASRREEPALYQGTKYSLTVKLTRDTRDYFLNPSRGRRDSLALELSHSDFRLRKVWLSLQQYFPAWRRQTVAIGLHGAAAWGTRFPPTELFYLGGASTLRGYDEDWFSGPRRVHVSLEYRFLVGRSSQVFVFTDAGAVTLVKRPSVFERVRVGYGFGARLESRGGILRLNYGLAAGESVLQGKIHVNLGAAF